MVARRAELRAERDPPPGAQPAHGTRPSPQQARRKRRTSSVGCHIHPLGMLLQSWQVRPGPAAQLHAVPRHATPCHRAVTRRPLPTFIFIDSCNYSYQSVQAVVC